MLVREGHNVSTCIMTCKSPTREDGLSELAEQTHKTLGVKKTYIGKFECMKLKDADHFEVVKFIESCIKDSEPDVVITHHPTDLHNDHNITSICCQEAVRLPQRMIGYNKPVKEFLFMEVKSSTEWALNDSMQRFKPNYYMSVKKEDIEQKINLIKTYKDVIRKHPHSRSEEALMALAIVRGSECGSDYAEAFQHVYGVK